ncbi:MAG: serine/threonine protein kinase [Planctomycetaceae bacterium]|nr:serine/threonine protein kinase [Planctomycetaceae bacterium]
MSSSGRDPRLGDLLRSLSEHERERGFAVGRYELGERIGAGATADVYRAVDRTLHREVAIKILRAGVIQDRFRREARILATLTHPNVVPIYDFGDADGRLYLVMELAEEPAAGQRLTAALLEQAARGVGAAHARGIVHRDLKPGNILVTADGIAKVADFGLAHRSEPGTRLTRSGVPLGTPRYMAPEQVAGTAISPATDVYALGALLYEAATGKAPYEAESVDRLYADILRQDPPRPRKRAPAVPKDLEAVILKAMDRVPARRYPTAREFAADLRRHLEGRPVEARAEFWGRRAVRALRRRSALTASAISLMAVAGLAGWRVTAEQEAALAGIRDLARMSLQSALEFRRVGANDRMRQFLPKLEGAYRETVRRAPGLAEPDYLLGRLHRALMDEERALEDQERALRKEPDHAGARYERAVLRSKEYGRKLRSGEVDAAALEVLGRRILEDCRQLDAAGIGEAHALAARGIMTCYQGRLEEARRLLRRAAALDPGLEEAWEAFVLASSRAGADNDQLEALYTEGLSRDRGYLPYLVGRAQARTERARERWERGADPYRDLDLAEEDLSRALQADASYEPSWWARGIARTHRGIYRMGLGDDPEPDCRAAVSDFTEQLARRPGNADALRRRGFARLQIAIYRRKQRSPSAGDLAAAAADLEESLRLDSAHPQAWNWHGVLSHERALFAQDPQADLTRGEGDFSEALQRRPGYADAWKFRGLLRLARAESRIGSGGSATEDLVAADADLTRALEIQPVSSEASTARAAVHRLLARAQGVEGRADLERAEAELRALLERNAAWAPAWALRGRVRCDLATLEEAWGNGAPALNFLRSAVTDFRRAVFLDPSMSNGLQADLDRAVLAMDRLGD